MPNKIRFKRISVILKDARVDANLSQADVADRLGYSTAQFVSNWERGLSSPPLVTLRQLSNLYDLSPKKLFDAMISDIEDDMRKEFFKKKAPLNSDANTAK